MNKHHKAILAELQKHAGKAPRHFNLESYLGTRSAQYFVSNPAKFKVAKELGRENKDISFGEFIKLLDSLNKGKSHEEKTIIGYLLQLFPKLRAQIKPKSLNKWLNNLHGWAEVDSLCQNVFTAEEMLMNWADWQKQLTGFAESGNISKRRASLVLLVGPVRHSADNRLAGLGFGLIEKLKNEKDVLITKAISWLLRDLIKNHRSKVAKYLAENTGSLPAIAVRETKNKLKTGKK